MQVIIDRMVFKKVMHWVMKADKKEVSGLGKIEYKDGSFIVTDAMMLKQTNTSGTTDIDEDAVNKAMFELKDSPGTLRWWWHSHVQMKCFWSKTDEETIQKLSEGGYVVATVFNQKYEWKSAVRQTDPILLENLDILTYLSAEEVHENTLKKWDKEYDENVTTTAITPVNEYNRNDYYGDNWWERDEWDEKSERPIRRYSLPLIDYRAHIPLWPSDWQIYQLNELAWNLEGMEHEDILTAIKHIDQRKNWFDEYVNNLHNKTNEDIEVEAKNATE